MDQHCEVRVWDLESGQTLMIVVLTGVVAERGFDLIAWNHCIDRRLTVDGFSVPDLLST